MRLPGFMPPAVAGAVLAAMFAAAMPATAQQSEPVVLELRRLSPAIASDAPLVNELVEKARTQGLVRVIAKVAAPAGGSGDLESSAEIARATSNFRERAQGLGIAAAEPVADLPLAVIETTAEQLQQLIAAGLISNVVEDIPEPATLQDSIPLIDADEAAVLGAEGAGQAVAILDTGVEANHAFFGGRVASEACFSSNSVASSATTLCPGGVTTSTAAGSGAPCGIAGCDHGTHVAGIAAGRDATRRGVAPQARIIAIQVFSRFTDVPGGAQPCADIGRASPCVLTFPSDQIRGLQRVFDLRNDFAIAAANMSLGGGNSAGCDTDTRKGLIDQLRTAGIATVISSGNGSSSTGVGAPGCISTAITVGNTTKADAVAGSSDSADVVDMLAPGSSISSSVTGGAFGPKTGTSMAAPHVAGAFAALRSVRNDLSVDQIEAALESTGLAVTDTRNNLVRPRIDVEAALRSATTPVWSGAIWRYTNVPCNGESCPGWQRLDNNRLTVAIVGDSDLYQMHNNGAIWRHTGTPCQGDSCPGWTRLDNNSMGETIAAGGNNLYQLHRDGAIWRHTGVPCQGESCPGWIRLDNNPMGAAIAAAGQKLYQLHRDGSIWQHTGTPCNGNSCPGWVRLDNNPMGEAIAAGGDNLYQLHRDGSIWRHTGTPCNGNSCPGWTRLDNNPMGAAIAASATKLYQLHRDGSIWEHTGTACQGNSCPGWVRLDNNSMGAAIAAAGSKLYQLHRDGAVWEYTGTPCRGESCPGWARLDNNSRTRSIMAAGDKLFQLHGSDVAQKHVDGRIWQSTGVKCAGDSCPGWDLIDNNGSTAQIISDQAFLYQLHDNGRIWRATRGPCQGDSCPGWQMLDNNPRTKAIATANGQLYQLHVDGRIWRSTGSTCQGDSCPGWQMLDNNARTRMIAAGGNQLYQLHSDGRVWRSTGAPCQGESCPGWQMLDNNARTKSIAAGRNQLYQLHSDGRVWRSTGVACMGESCPGWQMLDNNGRTRAIAASGNQLYQLHVDGRIWRSTGGACQGESCPGWQMLDNNPRTRSISANENQLYQLHADGRVWRSTGSACQGDSCPGWQMLDNNPRTDELSDSRTQ